MKRTMMTSLFAGALIAASLAAPAIVSAKPLAPNLLRSLTAAPEFDWDAIESVPDYLDRMEIERLERIERQRIKRAQKLATPTPRASAPIITNDSKTVWSTDRLDRVAREALEHYGVPKAEWNWVLAANRQVAFRESRNRPGAVSSSGTYQGLHQWSPSWGGEVRLNGEWSVKRFVKAYADGGKPNIRRHWKATIGSL